MPVTLNFLFQRQTERAILVTHGDGEPVWMPKSQLIGNQPVWDELGRGGEITLTLTDWIAREKGLSGQRMFEAATPAAPLPDVNEDKFSTAALSGVAFLYTHGVYEDGVLICVTKSERDAQMIAAAMALTEGRL